MAPSSQTYRTVPLRQPVLICETCWSMMLMTTVQGCIEDTRSDCSCGVMKLCVDSDSRKTTSCDNAARSVLIFPIIICTLCSALLSFVARSWRFVRVFVTIVRPLATSATVEAGSMVVEKVRIRCTQRTALSVWRNAS